MSARPTPRQQPPSTSPRFWEQGRGPASRDEMAVLSAMVIAMAARNAVEDLHASGAFSNAQAPSLNRRVRNRVYAVTLALQRLDRHHPDPGLLQLIEDQARIDSPALDPASGIDPDTAIAGAIKGAIREFALAEAIPADIATELEQAATRWAIDTLHDLQHIAQPKSRRQIAGLAWMLPRSWELPEIEPNLHKHFAGSMQSQSRNP